MVIHELEVAKNHIRFHYHKHDGNRGGGKGNAKVDVQDTLTILNVGGTRALRCFHSNNWRIPLQASSFNVTSRRPFHFDAMLVTVVSAK